MVDRRSLLKAGLGGIAASAFLGDASGAPAGRLLVIRNRGDDQQLVVVEVDGRVAYGPEASRYEDTIRNRDGRGFISAVLDPGAVDSFWVDGDVRRVEWTGSRPQLRLGGRDLDLDDYRGGRRDDDWGDRDDWDDRDRDRDRDEDRDRNDRRDYPSRVLFAATGDDLEAFLRVSGRIRGADRGSSNQIRVRLDRGELRRVYYSGNIRELRTANGEINVDIIQRR